MFYAKSKGAVKPDGIMVTDASVLSHGECGYAYIAGLDASSNPSSPIAFGPIIPGTNTMDINSNNGKSIIVRLDNTVTALPINSAGVMMAYGQDLLDPTDPIRGGKAPDVKWPK